MPGSTDIQQRYETALTELVEQLKRDRCILAAILCGSLSYDEVWEKSDIDLILVTSEDLKAQTSHGLVVDGINVHAMLHPRSKFKANLQGALQSSFMHSFVAKSTLLYSTDETIEDLYHNIQHLGARDREVQLLQAATSVLPYLAKAEKWFHVRHDLHYSFLWIMKAIEPLAQVEVLQQGEITSREVIQQALHHNPDLFNALYTDLIDAPKTAPLIEASLKSIQDYLLERLWIFQPILNYLRDANGIRSATEINHHFKNQMNLGIADFACEWLAEQEIIQRMSTPVRLTPKSRVEVEEAAYFYDGGME